MKPNIVFVLTDDQGYGDLGCGGNPIVKTPNIDAFADGSIRLTNYHVGPTCAPTRAGLMTGHYANSTGVWHTVGGRSLLRKDEWTIATALKDSGYHTGIFGKWHLGDSYPYRPIDRGFETAVVHGGGGISQTPDYWGNDYFDDTYSANGVARKYNGYCTDVFFSEALAYITNHKDEPFFCYIATNAPHGPFNVEDKYADKYRGEVNEDRARFYGMIENIDDNFGQLQKHLLDLGIMDNTILIFMTDNGTSCGVEIDKDQFVTDGYNTGLRGRKNSKYDGGHRVPFFISWPEGIPEQNRDLNQLTANVDFMPTLLDLCNIEVKDDVSFHGISLKELLMGEVSKLPDRAVVTDSQRLTRPIKWRKSAVMRNKWRLIDGIELYDIEEDREQRHDIATTYPDLVRTLRQDYEKWWQLVSVKFEDPIPLIIGECETEFTSHDIINRSANAAFSQQRIRQGHVCRGHYEVEVAKAGIYRFELRRWPKTIDVAINSGINYEDIEWSKSNIQEKNWTYYTGGVAFDFGIATIKIQDNFQQSYISDDDRHCTFFMDLDKGPATLEALFVSRNNDVAISPYFIYIQRVEG